MNAPWPEPSAVRTTCPYCGVGCGLLARPDGYGGAAITADPDHPANFGRICSKGSALGETLGVGQRLLYPMLRQPDGTLARADWPLALDRVADGFERILARHGPDAIAFYLSGQLLTEDYYVANKLMKGFIGSANVDTNSRLCMASSVAGHKRAFGADTVPGSYDDLDQADLLVLVGANAAWCHPVLFQRMVENKRTRGAKIVVIDPRRTATAEDADLYLAIAPGMDTALFCGLLAHLADLCALDYGYIDAHTMAFENTLAQARAIAPNLAATARLTRLPQADLARFFDLFRSTPNTVTCFSQGVNQSAQGTDKVNAIINCHLATGRIGKVGASPFSLTGQPNAMGGREVGGLANQLAAHMAFTPPDIDRVRRFWKAPHIATHEGLKAVQMFEAIARGEIKALWVMGTNPAVSLPNADVVRDALKKLELFVVSENVTSNDTVDAGPHVLLPAQAWGEKSGTVTNSERRISRQRAFLESPGEAKPDWWIVSEVAKRLGFGAAFEFNSAADVLSGGGKLYAFASDQSIHSGNLSPGQTITGQFLQIADPVALPGALQTQADNLGDHGAMPFVRLEDIDYSRSADESGPAVYFVDTGNDLTSGRTAGKVNVQCNPAPCDRHGSIYRMELDATNPTATLRRSIPRAFPKFSMQSSARRSRRSRRTATPPPANSRRHSPKPSRAAAVRRFRPRQRSSPRSFTKASGTRPPRPRDGSRGSYARSRSCSRPMSARWRECSSRDRRRPPPMAPPSCACSPRAFCRSGTERRSPRRRSRRFSRSRNPKRRRSGPLPISRTGRSRPWISTRRPDGLHLMWARSPR